MKTYIGILVQLEGCQSLVLVRCPDHRAHHSISQASVYSKIRRTA
jgi:hypothetical protein